MEEKVFYKCDPNKNTQCKKTGCIHNLDSNYRVCDKTEYKEFSIDGRPITIEGRSLLPLIECALCQSPSKSLTNTHNNRKKIELSLIGKGDDKGIVIFENNEAIATFDIKYCPICGKDLLE